MNIDASTMEPHVARVASNPSNCSNFSIVFPQTLGAIVLLSRLEQNLGTVVVFIQFRSPSFDAQFVAFLELDSCLEQYIVYIARTNIGVLLAVAEEARLVVDRGDVREVPDAQSLALDRELLLLLPELLALGPHSCSRVYRTAENVINPYGCV
jgi:hypothetical protein